MEKVMTQKRCVEIQPKIRRLFFDFVPMRYWVDNFLGTDFLVGVVYTADTDESEGTYPRKVQFGIEYFQKDKVYKRIVGAEMVLSEWDDEDDDTYYWLMLSFEALGWQDLMNNFQLDLMVYIVLYTVVGLASVFVCITAWSLVRLSSKTTKIPPIDYKEAYEFMLWWPVQGVSIASIPVLALFLFIGLMMQIDPTNNVPCEFIELENIGKPVSTECTRARVGVSFSFAGAFMLWSGAKLIIPSLRTEENQYLLAQTELVSSELIPIPTSNPTLVQELPVRWKRLHFIWVALLLVVPLVVVLEFSYSDFFGGNAVPFIAGFRILMMFMEKILNKAVREALLSGPLGAACEVTLFVATMGADDFVDFIDGYFIELQMGIAERLLLGSIIAFVEEVLGVAIKYIRSRNWFWSLLMT